MSTQTVSRTRKIDEHSNSRIHAMTKDTLQPNKQTVSNEKAKESKELLDFQLEILKTEIDLTNQAISRIDEITETTKNWTVVIWGGSIAVALGQNDLRIYIIFTAIIPLLFWFVDALWRYYLEGFIFRQDKISEFLNDPRLVESFKQGHLVKFTLLDPRGRQYRKDKDYKKSVNLWSAINLGEVSIFYIGLVLISIAAGLYFILKP